MRILFTFLVIFVLVSCLDESGISPGTSSTFVRFFNGGNNDVAEDLATAEDGGFIILATTSIQKQESDTLRTKIKLIKTDKDGNPLWQRLYPDFSVKDVNYTGASIQTVPNNGGYIISGSVIDVDGISKTLVMLVDLEGEPLNSVDLQLDNGISEIGRGIAINSSGNYLVLSSQGTVKMIISEIDKTTFEAVTTIGHFSGQTDITSRLVADDTDKAVWAGVITNSGLKGVRFTKTIPSNVNVEWDHLLGSPGFSEIGNDFCKYGLTYVVTGSTNKKPDGTLGADTDIFIKRIDSDGTPLLNGTMTFPIENQNDFGNSVNTTQDGGLIVLSSARSEGIQGRGDSDFYLIKLNGALEVEWTSAFGSKFKDEGVMAFQVSDGGYVILGTTTQGAIKIVTLMKTDKNGKIE